MAEHIELTPGTRGGRARIKGTRITVADIAVMHLRLGQSLDEISGNFDLPLAAVHAAMSYYYDHRADMDKFIEDDEAFAEAFRKNNPSLLREKLKVLAGG